MQKCADTRRTIDEMRLLVCSIRYERISQKIMTGDLYVEKQHVKYKKLLLIFTGELDFTTTVKMQLPYIPSSRAALAFSLSSGHASALSAQECASTQHTYELNTSFS